MIRTLRPGDAAPLFHAAAADGGEVSLASYRGRKVLLAFFRFSACALCNLRIHHFIGRYPQWRLRGMDVIALFESPPGNLPAYVGRQNAPFALAADPEAAIYGLYGVETSEEKLRATMADPHTKAAVAEAAAAGFSLTPEEGSNFHRIPAEFLIDEAGIVRVAHYGEIVTDLLPFEVIERFAGDGRLPPQKAERAAGISDAR